MSEGENMKRIIGFLAFAVVCSACGTTAKFVYPDNAKDLVQLSKQPKYEKVVAVTPFEDMRGERNLYGTHWLYLIPLMPFGYYEYQRPEAATVFFSVIEFHFDASEDLAKAAATSLRSSGLFKDAYFTFGWEKSKADLLFLGEVQSTKYHGTTYSYGLSAFGPVLWVFGLPAGTSENELVIRMEMRDARTNEKIWEGSYGGNKKITQGLYYRLGHDVRAYSELMEQVMNAALRDMDKEIQSGMKSQR